MPTLKAISQILRNDDVDELKRIWNTLPRQSRRKEIFAQAVRCGGCDKIVAYCAHYADNKIKSEVLMACALADDAKTCAVLAPLCKKEDVQKAAHQALLKSMCQSFLVLHPHCEIEILPEFLYEVLVGLNANYNPKNQNTSMDVFSILLDMVPKNILQEQLHSSLQLSSLLTLPTACFIAMKERCDSFYCKQNIQKELDEPSSIAKRKM